MGGFSPYYILQEHWSIESKGTRSQKQPTGPWQFNKGENGKRGLKATTPRSGTPAVKEAS